MQGLRVLLSAVTLFLTVGCSTSLVIVAPESASVQVKDDAGVAVAVMKTDTGSFEMPFGKGPYTIQVTKKGYAPFQREFTSEDYKLSAGVLNVKMARQVQLKVNVVRPAEDYTITVNEKSSNGTDILLFGGDSKVNVYSVKVNAKGYESFETKIDEAAYDKLSGGHLEVALPRWLSIKVKTELMGSRLSMKAPAKGKVKKTGEKEWSLYFDKSQPTYTLTVSSEGFPDREYRVNEAMTAERVGKIFSASVIRDTRYVFFDYFKKNGLGARVHELRAFPHGGKASRVAVLKDAVGVAGMAMRGDERVGYGSIELSKVVTDRLDILKVGDSVPVVASNIWEVSVLNGTKSRATSGGINVDPVYVPGSRPSLLVSTNRWRPGTLDIVQVWLDGGAATRVVEDSRAWLARSSSIDPTGAFAYSIHPIGRHIGNHPEIWFRPNARVRGNDTQLAKGTEPELDPGTGEWLVYIGIDRNLWKVRVDGTDLTQLTNNAQELVNQILAGMAEERREIYEKNPSLIQPYRDPTWSPDGQFILYASLEGRDIAGKHNYDIWKLNSNGTGKAQLTTNGSADLFPVVSPDNTPYFLSNRGAELGIYKLTTLE